MSVSDTDVTVIPLGAGADLAAARELQSQLTRSPRGRPLVVDLSEQRAMTPIVLGVLFACARGGRHVSLVVPDGQLRHILRRIQAESLVDVHPTLDQALAALSHNAGQA